jgi:SAM-dependent methyltransferase
MFGIHPLFSTSNLQLPTSFSFWYNIPMNKEIFTCEILDFLTSPAGAELLAFARDMDTYNPSDAMKLRKRCTPEQARAVLELTELRKRAGSKFPQAQSMFFDRVGYEQSSGQVLADYKAHRIASSYAGGKILDLCCGIGGDTIALANLGPVLAVDFSPARVKMAQLNLKLHNLADRCEFQCGDLTQMDLQGELFHIDPDRRAVKQARTVSIDEISPPKEYIDRLLSKIPHGVIKLSPATDFSNLPWPGEVELVSHKGQCRQLIVWTGRYAKAKLRATTLPSQTTIDDTMPVRLEISEIGKYLYDPDPCVSRLRLLGQLAAVMDLDFIASGQIVSTSNALVSHPLARAYRVEEVMPYHEGKMKKIFRDRQVGPVTVKPRGAEVNVDQLSKLFSGKTGPEKHLFLLRLDKKIQAVITTLECSEDLSR